MKESALPGLALIRYTDCQVMAEYSVAYGDATQ
jgi:hypothetical protein